MSAASITTATDRFDEMLQVLIRLQLEEQLRNPLPYVAPGVYIPASLVKGSNGTMRFLAVGDMPVDVSDGSDMWVVSEGEPNDSEDLVFGFEEFSVRQAMRTIRITDVAMKESPIELIPVAAEKLARSQIEAANAILAKTIVAGDNDYVVGGGAASALTSADVLDGASVRGAVAELGVGNVPTFDSIDYRAFIHPYVKLDLQGDEDAGGWIDARRYAAPGDMLTGELGQYAGVRFIKSIVGARDADAGSASFDVFTTPILGKGAVALGDFGALENFFTAPGGHSDPGHQSALATWKGWFGSFLVGEGDNASGPVSGPRYILVKSGASKDTNA